MSGESRLMSRNPYYCIHGAPLDRRCEACATAPDPVDDAAVEARWTIYKRTGEWDDVIEGADVDGLAVVPASLLAEARASLEREKVNRDRDGQTFADETDRLRAERDEAVEARENANALSIRLEGERDRAVARAEAAEASLAAATEALEDLLEEAQDMRAYVPDYFAKKWHHDEALDRAREALSRLAHSSEEER